MSEPINSIDFFTQFANETHRKITFTKSAVPMHFLNTTPITKRTISIPLNESNEIFLLCFNDPKNLAKHPFYCGVFFKSTVSREFELSIKKRFFLDRINPFNIQKNRFKTKTSFDSKAIIETNNHSDLAWLMNGEIQKIIIELFSIDQRITVGYNLIFPNFEESLKDKPTFGIFVDDWIFDKDKIEQLFEKAVALRTIIK
jgi:hypothetical protein